MKQLQSTQRNDSNRHYPSSHGRVWLRLMVLALVIMVSGAAFAGMAAGQSILEPASRSADRIAELWWLMFWLGTVVFVVVMFLVGFAVTRRRHNEDTPGLSNGRRQAMVLAGGVAVPFLILIVVFGYTLRTITGLADERSTAEWTIEVIAHQFWWEVRYPDEDVITANEIHIPAGEPVEFKLTSADVIHSFWVPELSGKIDMMPGTTTSLTVTADEPGRYRGQCSQFCGVQHANMAMYVIADKPNEFSSWLDQQRQVAEEPREGSLIARGKEVFNSSACVYCHTVRGSSPASGEIGPDLTHLASRETIAAGILENNRGNLAGWVVDPQHIKPGNLMPAVNLSAEELQALLAYLMSLD